MDNPTPISIDYHSKTPLAEQIAERMRAMIRAGTWLPDEALPTVRQLAFQLGVNFNTVARAYRMLDAEGIIITWQGRGTYVSSFDSNASADDQPRSTAQRIVKDMLEQTRQQHVTHAEIRNAIYAQFGSVSAEPARRPKTKRMRHRSKPALKPANGISLRRAVKTAHLRRKRKPRSVSRET